MGGCSPEVNSDFTRFPCFLLLSFLLNTRETMNKHRNFTRDLNSGLLGRRFEFDFIELQFLSTSRYHEIT